MTTNFYECIHTKLVENAERELIVWPDTRLGGQSYTGSAILDRIADIGSELVRVKVQPGQRVMLAMPVTFDLICTLLATMAMGAIPVLPPAAPSLFTLLSLMRNGSIRALVTQRDLPFPLSWLVKRLGVSPVFSAGFPASTAPVWCPAAPVDPDQPALISHSSGSTGAPKPIRRSHRVLRAQHQALSAAFPPWPNQRDFPLFPNILLHNLAVGTVSILPDLPGFLVTQMEPVRLVQQLVNQRIQTLTGNVYYFRKLLAYLENQSLTFPHVRAVGLGGSPVPEVLAHSLKRFFVRADIYIIYGSSEAEPIAVRKVGSEPVNPRLGYAVGTIPATIQVQIRPLALVTLADGTTQPVGEIAVSGAHVATAGSHWLATGDFGYVDRHNRLFLTGRRGNERVHQGVQHYQVEHVLLAIKGVERVAARATKSGFTIYIEGKPTADDLWKALAENFPGGLFSRIHFRKRLPVDARHQSKIRYEQLR